MSMKRYLLAAALVAAFVLPAMGQTAGQGTRIKSGASVPVTCIDSSGNTEIFIKTGTGPYYCDGGTYAAVGGAGSGTVTSIATTLPITGGTITTTGTIACPTCVTASSPGAGVARFAGSTQAVTSAELSGDATTSGSNAVTVAKVNGTSVPTNSAADQVILTTASATAAWKTLTNCANDGGHAVTYDTSSHGFGCASITAGGISGGFAWGGDGTDGAPTADGSTTLTCLGAPSSSIYTMTRDCIFTGLTVNSGVTVKTNNFALFVQGTLTNSSGGIIQNNGTTGSNGSSGISNAGANGGAGVAGAGSATGRYPRFATSVSGTNGGSGGTTTGTQAGAANGGGNASNAIDASGSSGANGNAGGVGGTGTSGAGGSARSGGAAGTVSLVAAANGHNAVAAQNGGFLNVSSTVWGVYTSQNAGNGGAPGGSGGGGDTTNAGGGGGGGGAEGGSGGMMGIFAKTISNAGTISSNGGTGGDGGNGRTQSVGNVGGGGGGAGGSGGKGGIVWLVYQSLTNTGTISANGGTHGNGGTKGSPHGTGTDNAANGSNGPDGPAGIVIQIAN